MKTRAEYLKELGFSPTDSPSPKEIKSAYRKLTLKEHPDKGGNPEKFRAITEAYEALESGKYLDDKKPDELSVPSADELSSRATNYLYNLLNTASQKVDAKGKKKIVKLIGNKIVVIDNQATEDKFVKVDDRIIKVENE